MPGDVLLSMVDLLRRSVFPFIRLTDLTMGLGAKKRHRAAERPCAAVIIQKHPLDLEVAWE